MTDLSEFLLARLDERAAIAHEIHTFACTYFTMGCGEGWCTCGEPERVFADVEAKRAIVEHYQRWAATLRTTPEGWTAEGATAYRMAMEWTLRLLAMPYAAHRDYREEWRP